MSGPERPVGLVTGALSGIGAATAVAFAAEGAHLVLVDRSPDAGNVADEVRAAGGNGVVVEANVRDAGAMQRAVEIGLDAFGRIDFVVANAGIADQSTIADGDPERWRAVVETNVLGVLFTVRAALPTMIEARRGHIFIVASISGRETYVGEPAYIASKWGQVGFGHALREEVRDAGIRVTLVEPGIVDTPLTRNSPAVRPLLEAVEPLQAADVARAIVFAYSQPEHVVVSELAVRPLRQVKPDFGPEPSSAATVATT
jgi:NADP-dependent 3-hydroxy acid dehydrogenase YdfG